VVLPEGYTYNLGSVSVLKLVTSLAPNNRAARAALNEFLSKDSTKLAVDLDDLSVLLAPKKARWAALKSDTSSIEHVIRTPVPRGSYMDPKSFISKLANAEKTVEYLVGAARAGNAAAVKGASEALARRIAALATAAEQQGQEEEESDKKAAEMPDFIKDKIDEKKEEDKKEKEASFESLDTNAKIAEEILSAVQTADEGVDRAVKAGKAVNASKAKGDLIKIASRLSSILVEADLAQPWVQQELTTLSARANTIAGYFAEK
jgi:uncharacterized membrane protein YukC